jgi:putative transposase
MLEYKCKREGINFVKNEESYTSKCSFIDGEEIKKHTKYLGKRIKRGLFKSASGKLINADLNGSLNILKKVVGEFQYPIEVCSTPKVINLA